MHKILIAICALVTTTALSSCSQLDHEGNDEENRLPVPPASGAETDGTDVKRVLLDFEGDLGSISLSPAADAVPATGSIAKSGLKWVYPCPQKSTSETPSLQGWGLYTLPDSQTSISVSDLEKIQQNSVHIDPLQFGQTSLLKDMDTNAPRSNPFLLVGPNNSSLSQAADTDGWALSGFRFDSIDEFSKSFPGFGSTLTSHSWNKESNVFYFDIHLPLSSQITTTGVVSILGKGCWVPCD